MYFRNNVVDKGLPRDTKPTPFPRTLTSDESQVTSTTVNALNKNCYEVVNDGHNLYQSLAPVQLGLNDENIYLEDDTEDKDHDDFSNDMHQRLIL